jgi:hypothetical protein
MQGGGSADQYDDVWNEGMFGDAWNASALQHAQSCGRNATIVQRIAVATLTQQAIVPQQPACAPRA